MAINEVVANRAIELPGGEKGDYSRVHPLNDVNMSQSTNDVYPTALRISSIRFIRKLSNALAELQESLQIKENEFSNIIMLGRTQLMDAVPMMAGQLQLNAFTPLIADSILESLELLNKAVIIFK